jgi:hypothetical protein
MTEALQSAPARSCGSCSMCCKLPEIPWVDNKPRGHWCKHCKPGRGCGIWDTRPQPCKEFHCEWIKDASLGDEWKPDRSRFYLNFREALGILTVMVDPGSPNSWRREPYHAFLRALAESMAQKQFIIQVVTLQSVVVLGPDKEFPVGDFDGQLKLRWQTQTTPRGIHYELIGVARAEQAAIA